MHSSEKKPLRYNRLKEKIKVIEKTVTHLPSFFLLLSHKTLAGAEFQK